jgi:enoyl-CoA hydratase/carnithine racemase
MDALETLLYEQRDDGVAIVTLNRPERHNAFNFEMQQELRHVWTSLRENDDVRAVVLTGAGDEAFCTGIDRDEQFEAYLAEDGTRPKMGRVSTPFMYNSPQTNINPKALDFWKPVIAAVNGMACGGALYMLGEVDIIIAAEHATFFDPHVTYGMVCGFEAVHLLQKLPLGETLRLALLGLNERISAQRAYDVGLVSEIAPAAELRDRAIAVAADIASAPTVAVQGTLRAIWMAHENGRRQALDMVPTYITLGTERHNVAAGEDKFRADDRPDFRLR